MYNLYMTAYGGKILGPIAKVFGLILNAIYNFFEGIFGVGNVSIGFIIIIFTIVVYILMLPLTYQQQKFANLQKKIQPELKEIQKKYSNKKDQASMMKQQEETQALYDKYGISMSGSCVQLLIQLPIIYALFGVFNNLPAYISYVRNIFNDVVTNIQADPNYTKKMQTIYEGMNNNRLRIDFIEESDPTTLSNYIIDLLYKLNDRGWDSLRESFSSFSDIITTAQNSLNQVNYFFVLNISDTPLNTIKQAWGSKAFGVLFAALMIPIISYLSQVLNLKLASAKNNNQVMDQTAQQMQTMNRIMPLISLFFVFSVPIGLGLYWIAGALFRSLNMFILNKHFERMDLDKIIEKNKEKAAQKKKKRIARNENIRAAATMNTKKSMSQKADIGNKEEILEKSIERRKSSKPGSMASKANLVAEFNQKNTRK